MKLRRLRDPLHRSDFRQNLGQQPQIVERLKPAPRTALGQDARQFIANPLGRDVAYVHAQLSNGLGGRRLNREAQTRRETRRA